MTQADPKEKILDAAEQLFAEGGFAASSVRAITSAAGVNLAALHYHFGSKEALVEAVFARRIGPLNRERLEKLQAVEDRFPNRPPPLEAILKAFFGPPVRLVADPSGRGEIFLRLMGRAYSEPGDFFDEIVARHYSQPFSRFLKALARALPQLPAQQLFLRTHFLIGMLAHTLSHTLRIIRNRAQGDSIPIDPRLVPDRLDVEHTIRALVSFGMAGLQSPISNGGGKS